MNTKRTYSAPKVERIVLDNEISLVLESSNPPVPPWETKHSPNHPADINDPYKNGLA